MAKSKSPKKPASTCGDHGGRNDDGTPCGRRSRGRCHAHPESGTPAPEVIGGRPRKEITSDVDLKLIEELAADGLTQEQICHYLGIPISERTLRRRIQDDEDVQVVYRRGRARYMRQVLRLLIKAGSGDKATLKAITREALDEKHDTPAATQKIIETITTSLLPAGSTDVAVLAVQNLIIANGVFGRLADGRADFLADRIVLGPYPAVEGLKTEPYFDEEIGRW